MSYRANARLQLVYLDVCGRLRVKSLGHAIYFLTLVDDYSRMTFVYFFKRKSEVGRRVRDFVEYVERQTREKVKHLRFDHG